MISTDYFCCYHEYREKLAKLSDQELGRLFRALLEYSATGEPQQLAGREDIAFDFIAADIDKSRKEWEARSNRNRKNGEKGGRPKKTDGFYENQPVSEKTQKTHWVFEEEKKEKKKKQKEKKVKEEDIYPPNPPRGGRSPASVGAPGGAGSGDSVCGDSAGSSDSEGGFGRFWQAYPRKIGKGTARKAWEKLRPGDALTETILAAVERDKGTEQWRRERGRFVPYPATWLNQSRWEDDPDDLENPENRPETGDFPNYEDEEEYL